VYPAVLLRYFISAADILLASLALTVNFHCHITTLGGLANERKSVRQVSQKEARQIFCHL
jgi:hypothetical protein